MNMIIGSTGSLTFLLKGGLNKWTSSNCLRFLFSHKKICPFPGQGDSILTLRWVLDDSSCQHVDRSSYVGLKKKKELKKECKSLSSPHRLEIWNVWNYTRWSWRVGAAYRGRHNKLFYFQTHTFSVTATQGSGCSFCALELMSRHQVGMKKSYQRPNFHCLILTLYHKTRLPWTSDLMLWAFWFFRKLAFFMTPQRCSILFAPQTPVSLINGT